MNNILVTGGAGFIGSHTSVALLEAGYSVVIADDFSNSKPQTLERIGEITGRDFVFCEADVTDRAAVAHIFDENKIDGVIHFAGFKAVGESVEKPLEYYYNNLVSTIELAKACVTHGVKHFVFSSSATVYGDNQAPFVETMPLLPATNPYGETKVISEKILSDTAKANPGFSVALLRYFNPIGGHPSGLLGDDPNGIPNNLMPYIARVAAGQLDKLTIFGDDYPTPDGTCRRDYLHVVDLAKGHLKAIDYAMEHTGAEAFNLGTGHAVSVLELVNTFMEATGVNVPYVIGPRREGDLPQMWADTHKAETILGWKAEKTVADMCRDSWNFVCSVKKQ